MPDFTAILRYERASIASGEWWRLITAHLMHLSLVHALLNALAAVLLGVLFRHEYSPRQWLIIVMSSVLAIDAGLWLLDPGVQWYVGASGVLHGVMAAGSLSHVISHKRDGWLLLALLTAKLVYEHLGGALPLMQGFPVIIDAHLYGAIGGLAAAASLKTIPKMTTS